MLNQVQVPIKWTTLSNYVPECAISMLVIAELGTKGHGHLKV